MLLDSIHFGKHSIRFFQDMTYWVSGSGTLDGAELRQDWKVQVLP